MGQGLSGAKSKIAGVLGGGGTEGDAAASGGRSPTTPVEGQYTVKEALELQKALKAAFAEDAFQKLLKHAQDNQHTNFIHTPSEGSVDMLIRQHLPLSFKVFYSMSTAVSFHRRLGASKLDGMATER
eukprot:g22113.t1